MQSFSTAYAEHLRALSPEARRRSLLHRGTKNAGVPIDEVVLPEGWHVHPNAALPETQIDVGWGHYHLLRISLLNSSPVMSRVESLELARESFPGPEFFVQGIVTPCVRTRVRPRAKKSKAKRERVATGEFVLLYVYVRTEHEVESEFISWWE